MAYTRGRIDTIDPPDDEHLVARNIACIPHGHLHTVTYTRGRIDTIDCPDDEHLVARNM